MLTTNTHTGIPCTILTLIKTNGKERVRALIGCKPIRRTFQDACRMGAETFSILCEVDESRYSLTENYKIGWKPIQPFTEMFYGETFYVGDFETLVNSGSIKIYVEIY